MPVDAAGLLVVSAISIWSHPFFDWLNTYGVRLLMPFSGRWFYGDAIFIIDPWIWSALALGVTMSLVRARRVPIGGRTSVVMRRAERPARVALMAVAAYIVVMFASSRIARVIVERQAVAAGAAKSNRVMVSPMPLTPLNRTVVRDLGARYELGAFAWTPRPKYTRFEESVVALSADSSDAANRATDDQRARSKFLAWTRFPFRETVTVGDTVRTRLDDVRYGAPGRPGFSGVVVHTEIRRP